MPRNYKTVMLMDNKYHFVCSEILVFDKKVDIGTCSIMPGVLFITISNVSTQTICLYKTRENQYQSALLGVVDVFSGVTSFLCHPCSLLSESRVVVLAAEGHYQRTVTDAICFLCDRVTVVLWKASSRPDLLSPPHSRFSAIC